MNKITYKMKSKNIAVATCFSEGLSKVFAKQDSIKILTKDEMIDIYRK